MRTSCHQGGNKGLALLPRLPVPLGSHPLCSSPPPPLPPAPLGPRDTASLSALWLCREVAIAAVYQRLGMAEKSLPTGPKVADMASAQSPGPGAPVWLPRGAHAPQEGSSLPDFLWPRLLSRRKHLSQCWAAFRVVFLTALHLVMGPALSHKYSFLSAPPPSRFGRDAWA